MQTFFVGVQANPAPNVQADVEFSMVGNASGKPNRGYSTKILLVRERPFRLYGASLKWNEKWPNLDAFFRKGHYHWGFEERLSLDYILKHTDGPNLDIFNGASSQRHEIEGKNPSPGFKVAMGPELWWGANPAVLAKYYKEYNQFSFFSDFP